MTRGLKSATTGLMVIGFVAIVAIVVWRSSRAEPEAERADAASDERGTTREPARPAHEEPRGREQGSVAAPTAAPPAQARPSLEPTNAPGVEPFSPEVREHAKQMIVPNTQQAMEKGDVKQLYTVLELVQQHRGDKLLPESDIGAIEAAIACLEHEPDAHEEAADLLRFGPPTTFAASLNKACNRR